MVSEAKGERVHKGAKVAGAWARKGRVFRMRSSFSASRRCFCPDPRPLSHATLHLPHAGGWGRSSYSNHSLTPFVYSRPHSLTHSFIRLFAPTR